MTDRRTTLLEPGWCHVCGEQTGSHLCIDGKQRIPLHAKYQRERTPTPREHVEHTDARCCGERGHHVMPHRGCVLR